MKVAKFTKKELTKIQQYYDRLNVAESIAECNAIIAEYYAEFVNPIENAVKK